MQGGQPLLVHVDRDLCADKKLTEATTGRADDSPMKSGAPLASVRVARLVHDVPAPPAAD
jgi:hypothetical protein